MVEKFEILSNDDKRRGLADKIASSLDPTYAENISKAIDDLLVRCLRAQRSITGLFRYKELLPIEKRFTAEGEEFYVNLPYLNEVIVGETLEDICGAPNALFEVFFDNASIKLKGPNLNKVESVEIPDKYIYFYSTSVRLLKEGSLVIALKKFNEKGMFWVNGNELNGDESAPFIFVYNKGRYLAYNLHGDRYLSKSEKIIRAKKRKILQIATNMENGCLDETREKILSRIIRRWQEGSEDFSYNGLSYIIQADLIRVADNRGRIYLISPSNVNFSVGLRYANQPINIGIQGSYAVFSGKDNALIDAKDLKGYVWCRRVTDDSSMVESLTIREKNFGAEQVKLKQFPHQYYLATSKVKKELEGHDRAALMLHNMRDGIVYIDLLVLKDGQVQRYDISDRVIVYKR